MFSILSAAKLCSHECYYTVLLRLIWPTLHDELSTQYRCTLCLTAHCYFFSFQPVVSALFLVEIIGVLCFHLLYRPNQFRLFYTDVYYWYLLVIAVGSAVGSIPPLYCPERVGNGLALFQVSLSVDIM